MLEGGSIEVNGAGTLLTTEQCLLNPNRNPQLGRADIERILRDAFGVTEIVWLGLTASKATTRTATSTTSRASSRRIRS